VVEREIDISVFAWNFVATVEDGCNKNVVTSHVLVVEELLALVEEGGILSISQELEIQVHLVSMCCSESLGQNTYHRSGNWHTVDYVLKHAVVKQLDEGVSELHIVPTDLQNGFVEPCLVREFWMGFKMLGVCVWFLDYLSISNALKLRTGRLPGTISCPF
jgi:hypothetical protein